MKVKQLIKQLEKYPADATVVIQNDSVFEDGVYKVTDVDNDPYSNTVEIVTDHIWKQGEDGKWHLN